MTFRSFSASVIHTTLAMVMTLLLLAGCSSSHLHDSDDDPDAAAGDAAMGARRDGGGLRRDGGGGHTDPFGDDAGPGFVGHDAGPGLVGHDAGPGFVGRDGGDIVGDGDAGMMHGEHDAGGPGMPGIDAGMRMPGTIGTPCGSAADCPGLFCSPRGSGFGYCSWVCSDTSPCPGSAVCARFDTTGTGYCMQACNPRASDCAHGFVCTSGITTAPVCYPGCRDESDCEAGQRCGPPGFGGIRACYSPPAVVGAACSATGDCPESGYCLDEGSWGAPHGMCVTFCDLRSGVGCATGTTCVPWGSPGTGSCVPTCDSAHPCRSGYDCVSTGDRRPSACVARCTTNDDCTGTRRCNFVTGLCGEF